MIDVNEALILKQQEYKEKELQLEIEINALRENQKRELEAL